MAYCTAAEVQRQAGGLANLIALTDVEAEGEVNTSVLEDAMADASTWIDSYAQKRHATPFASPSARIVRMATQETVYLLRQIRAMVTDEEQLAHEERRLWLVDLSMGKASVGEDPPPARSSEVIPEVFTRDANEPISRDAFKGFV